MFERSRVSPFKKSLFWCNGPSIKAAQISLGHQKNHFGPIFIEFGDTQKCHTFGGLELVPKRELAVSAACTKVKNAFKPFGIIRNKFLLLKTTEYAPYVRSLGKKSHFGAYPEAEKGVTRYTVRATKKF